MFTVQNNSVTPNLTLRRGKRRKRRKGRRKKRKKKRGSFCKVFAENLVLLLLLIIVTLTKRYLPMIEEMYRHQEGLRSRFVLVRVFAFGFGLGLGLGLGSYC